MPLTQLDGSTTNRTNETCDAGLGDTCEWGSSEAIFEQKKKKKWGEKWRSGHKLSIFLRTFKAGNRLCSARMLIRNCTA